MKKSITVFMALIMVSMVTFGGVIEGPSSSVYGAALMKKGKTCMLYYKNEKPGNVIVTIYDANNTKLFTETLRNVESFSRPYNFSTMADGEYAIAIENENGKQVERVLFTSGKIEKLASVVKLSSEDNKYVLSLSNKADNDITVNIYDGANTLVYSSTENIHGDFAKIYNLKTIQGRYTFQITDKSGVSKTILY